MIIRKATCRDADAIAACMLLAMEEIVHVFIGEQNKDSARSFLKFFIEQKNNQYSFQNCWVVADENDIIAAANVYNGAELNKLREPIIAHVRSFFRPEFNPEDETQAGEHYIDTIGVMPDRQSEGIGKLLLQFLIDKYVNQEKQPLGLLVDVDNPMAERLYLKLGFKEVGSKTLAGKRMKHLQVVS